MPDLVLRNENLPDLPLIVSIPDGTDLSVEYVRSGWVVDESTTPADLAPKPESDEITPPATSDASQDEPTPVSPSPKKKES